MLLTTYMMWMYIHVPSSEKHHKKKDYTRCQVFLCNDILSVRTRGGEKKQI